MLETQLEDLNLLTVGYCTTLCCGNTDIILYKIDDLQYRYMINSNLSNPRAIRAAPTPAALAPRHGPRRDLPVAEF